MSAKTSVARLTIRVRMETENIVVCKMQKNHIDNVYRIECASFHTPWSVASLKSELKNNYAHYYVAMLDEKIIGFGGMWQIFDEAHITNVAIDTPYRGKGYSLILMKELMSEAVRLGATKMTLEVRERNYVAQGLYAKLGFVKRGVRRRYYEDTGEDAYILWADLIPPQAQGTV